MPVVLPIAAASSNHLNPAMRFPVSVCLATMLFGSLAPAQVPGNAPPPVSSDVIFIVAMTPESVTDGVETEVALTVAYDLTSAPEAVIDLAANTLRPESFSTFTSLRVTQGSGTVTVQGKLTPRFWTANIVPRVKALLVVAGDPLMPRKATASDGKAMAVVLRPNASETYAVNPNPSVVHENGVRIKSITPDRFVEGQPIDVEVVVNYELRSSDVGELGLNFSRGMANSYFSVTRLQVNAGSGEAVLRGRVVPKRTGKLPFAKLHVILNEFPKRQRTVALASDDETVEVR